MKVAEQLTELRGLTAEDLRAKVKDLEDQIFRVRLQLSMGQTESAGQVQPLAGACRAVVPAAIAHLGDGPLHVAPLGEGHSNLTFLVGRDGGELVLRRPPPGPLLPTAHDVLREARGARVVLIATGSEVGLALAAAQRLADELE